MSDKLRIINFTEDHPLSQLYYKTWQRTHLPSTCDWKYGRNATELRHAAKLNGQQHHREDCQDRATVLLVCAGDGLKLR